MKPLNPFITSGYYGPEYFCDRKEEAKQLEHYMLNGIHTTLFAIRRLGKTGLLHHVFYPYQNSKKMVCIYVDILATNSLADFTNQLATAIYNRFPADKTIGKKIISLIQGLRPVISFDELSGAPSVSLGFQTKAQKENTLSQLFQFLDQQGSKVVFAIDEFQQILEYPERNTEALLRTQMQQLKNTSFIFCGSNQRMMHEIFHSAKRPFFGSCANLTLDFISDTHYKAFIAKQFLDHHQKIESETIDFICEWTQRHTFYTQYLCFSLFALNKKIITLMDAHETAASILKINENIYYQYRHLLTKAQWNLLQALAKEEKVYQPQAKKFISQYQLETPSLVKRGLDSLLKKELIFLNAAAEKPYYEVYDKYLMRWLQQH
jgi:AAA+ ATPase superfamily predicted ATPase